MRDLTNDSKEKAVENGWIIVKPLNCEVVGKAVLKTDEMSIMKSTKRFKVEGGWIYNTSTEVHAGGRGLVTIAEALVFVPDVSNDKPNKNIEAPPNINTDMG
jgi:hypothetical protein